METTIRERLGLTPLDEVREQAEQEAEFRTMLEHYLIEEERVTALDERLPEDGKTRNSVDTLNRGIERLERGLKGAVASAAYDGQGLLDWSAETLEYDTVQHYDTYRQRWLTDAQQDLQDNFVYQTYLEQLFSNAPTAAAYPSYALHLAIRAAMVYLATCPEASIELGLRTEWRNTILTDKASYAPSHAYPYKRMRDQAIKFLEWEDVGEINPRTIGEYIALAETYVPRIIDIADQMLAEYSDAVRIERARLDKHKRGTLYADTPLPDEPEGQPTSAERRVYKREFAGLRMERAVIAYASDETANYKEIAKDYGVNNEALRKELKARNLTKTRGGDRKMKSKGKG